MKVLVTLKPGTPFYYHHTVWIKTVSGATIAQTACVKVKTGDVFEFYNNQRVRRIPRWLLGLLLSF